MLLLTIISLVLLGVVNFRFGGKATLYPPVVFCAVWASDLLIVWLAGDFFYPLLPETLGFLFCGALTFSIGCWAAELFRSGARRSQPQFQNSSNRILSILVTGLVAATPFYCHWVGNLVSDAGTTGNFLFLARTSLVEQMGKSLTFSIFGTLSELALIIAVVAFYERKQHPKRAYIAIVAALLMAVLLGKKEGVFVLFMGLIGVEWLRVRRVNWKLLITCVVVFAVVAAAVEFYVHIGGDSVTDKLIPIGQNLALYAAGGVVGFDQVMRQPNIVSHINPFEVLGMRVLRRLGYNEDIPETADFVGIGLGVEDNVYTMYWDYLVFGLVGALSLTALQGFVLNIIYQRAVMRAPICVLLYALSLRGIVLGPFNEHFIAPYFLAETVLVGGLVYASPILYTRVLGSFGSHRLAGASSS